MPRVVDKTLTIAAPPKRVWKAWVEDINRWWTKPYYNDHERVTGLYMEPQLGGRFIEKWGENGEGFLIGHVIEWLPPTRLAYTWSERTWAGAVTVARLDFQPDGNGGTQLRFTQEGFERLAESDRQRDGYEYGWGELSGRLKAYLEKGTAT
jgi:uncharacterized protein YndB with AHSA1/START domain